MAKTDNPSLGRRKIKNILLAPKAHFGTAIFIFALGFLFISILFGVLLFRLNDMIQTLASLAQDPEQAAAATANTSIVLMTTYCFLLLSFLCSALFLGLTITHRYLGPMVPIQRHVKNLLEGKFDKRIQLRKNDQFKELAEDLNRLAARLQRDSSAL